MSMSSERPRGPQESGPIEGLISTGPEANVSTNRSNLDSESPAQSQAKEAKIARSPRLAALVQELLEIVYETIALHCPNGCTNKEIASITGLRKHVIAPRLSELQAAGHVEKVGKRWDGISERSSALFAAIGGAS